MIIIESIIVGLYSYLISLLFNNTFIIGFIKHFVAGYFGIHKMYCKTKYEIDGIFPLNILILESVLEGLLFTILYNIINIKNNYVYFLIGFILHALFEITQLHFVFCSIHSLGSFYPPEIVVHRIR